MGLSLMLFYSQQIKARPFKGSSRMGNKAQVTRQRIGQIRDNKNSQYFAKQPSFFWHNRRVNRRKPSSIIIIVKIYIIFWSRGCFFRVSESLKHESFLLLSEYFQFLFFFKLENSSLWLTFRSFFNILKTCFALLTFLLMSSVCRGSYCLCTLSWSTKVS